MLKFQSLDDILKSCSFNMKIKESDYFEEITCCFHWNELINNIHHVYGLPIDNYQLYSKYIPEFRRKNRQNFNDIKHKCVKLILNYQILKILESCSSQVTFNTESIEESSIKINEFLFKIKEAYDINLEKWQIFSTSRVTLHKIVDDVSHKLGFNKEATLPKEKLNTILRLKYTDTSTKNISSCSNQQKKANLNETKENKIRKTPNHMPNSKANVEAMYYSLIGDLNHFKQDLDSIKAQNTAIKKLQSGLMDSMQTLIRTTKHEADEALHEIPWDRLVIAFFGETNAGKSTIIETFRILFDKKRKKNSDGLIVGDGRQDFTKDYHEYNFTINNRPFTLIDVPGIEGNESEFKDIIKNALRKAHCVFYVQGHNKKPDSATAQKIKKYLGNWVNVYSIQNIRGSVSDYDEEEERETLLTPNVLKNESLIRSSFEEILGEVYKGNIPLQALLAMCAQANFSNERPDLQKKQDKLLKYFHNADEILKFSQFQTIINLVTEKSSNFTDEILKSNQQKLISLCYKVNEEMHSIVKQEEQNTEDLRNRLIEFRRESKAITSETYTSLSYKLNSQISTAFSILKNNLFEIIDKADKQAKELAEIEVYDLKNSLSEELYDIVENEILTMEQKLKTKKKKLEGVNLQFNFDCDFYVDINIDTDEALSELNINLDDIGDFALSTAGTAATGALIGSIIPGVGTVVGGILGGVVGAVGNGFFHNDGKGDAKNILAHNIDDSKNAVKRSIDLSLRSLKTHLNNKQRQIEKGLNQELQNLDVIHGLTISMEQKMNIAMQKYKN